MMFCILSKVIREICPATANTNHHSLAFTHEANEELDRLVTPGSGEMV